MERREDEMGIMDTDTFKLLLTGPGQAALTAAAALTPTETAFLTCFEQLRKHYPPALAKAALETALLRIKARAKFPRADDMYFTRQALEQATSGLVAAHRATRFAAYDHVADLCCGIGGDTLALAATGRTVVAVDTDPLRIAMVQANATVLGYGDRVRGIVADALSVALPDAQAAFVDPDRRTTGRRHLDPEDYAPPLTALRARFPTHFPLAVKAAPGIHQAKLHGIDAEVEFVALHGELKECVLWFGPFRTVARRATVLPSGDTLTADVPCEPQPQTSIRAFLYDPSPAVVRAGLVHDLAARLDARPIDDQVLLLTSSRYTPTPFATALVVEHVVPYHPRLLCDYLRQHRVGRITVIKRGSPADADQLHKKLHQSGFTCHESGFAHRTVVLTRAARQHIAIVGERLT